MAVNNASQGACEEEGSDEEEEEEEEEVEEEDGAWNDRARSSLKNWTW